MTRKYTYTINNITQDIKKFECSLCLSIYQDPVLDKCGHTFCKNCVTQLQKNDNKCPISRKIIKEFFPNSILKDIISNLDLICDDCGEICNIKDKKKHEIICDFKKNCFTKEKVIDEYMKLYCDTKILGEKNNRMMRIKKISKIKNKRGEKGVEEKNVGRREFFSFSNFDFNEFFGQNSDVVDDGVGVEESEIVDDADNVENTVNFVENVVN